MLELILSAVLLGSPVSLLSAGDTLQDLREGDRVVLRDFRGEVEVVGWDRGYMAVEADSDEETRFEFQRSGNQVMVRVVDRKSRNRAEELTLRVPLWVELDLSGQRLEVQLRGVEGAVKIRTFNGDITLQDLPGRVDVTTTGGEISARGLTGTAILKSGSGDITIRDSSGDLTLEAVSGEVEMTNVSSESLAVSTTSGDIDLFGRILPGGDYHFRSHSGDLTLHLEEPLNINVSLLVYEGAFESDFPVRARGFTSGEEMEFTLGSGGGRLTAEAFNGDVALLRWGGS
jgi:DUF4097 and DUF4098 domain-containing protein YvlB